MWTVVEGVKKKIEHNNKMVVIMKKVLTNHLGASHETERHWHRT